MPAVRPATLADADRVTAIAATGFYDDPLMGWLFPDDAVRLDRLRRLFGGLVRDTLPDRGTIHLLDDSCTAIWRDPSFEHGRMAADRVQQDDAAAPFTDEEMARLTVLGAAMVASHPHEPHWYLNVVSTMPPQQGQGLGTAVLQPVLARCDADGTRAYLESTNPRNHTLYHRMGFVDTGEIAIDGGPSLTPMWREPR
jgi:GNAT superfamily N-acetyltransferase